MCLPKFPTFALQMNERKDIRELTIRELEEVVKGAGEPAFKAKQIIGWLWKRSATSFEEMSNLSKGLRTYLETHFELRPIQEDVSQNSSDGTIKTRFTLHDGHLIESVLIPVPDQDRYTVCISSQVGCSLACSFCATGKMDRIRNLTAGEIYDQVVQMNTKCLDTYSRPITNIVYMGMGEPLLAYKPVMQSIDHLTQPYGLDMSPKRITVSTAGIAKMIKKMADDGTRVNLALSLHAADDIKRNAIMAINESNNLDTLVEALNYFFDVTKGNKLTFEYIAFDDFNESIEDAKKLLSLCRRVPSVKVNIIEYNQVEGVTLHKADTSKTDQFAAYLKKNGISATIRRSRGKDIDAACGQLANK